MLTAGLRLTEKSAQRWAVMVGLAVVLAGCQGQPAPPVLPHKVRVATVRKERVDFVSRYRGSVIPARTVVLSNRVAGQVTWMAELGSEVKKGELVLELDPSSYQVDKRELEAQLAVLKAEQTSLAESPPPELLKLIAARITLTEAKLKRVEDQISHCKLTSPIDGLASARWVAAGEQVQPGDRLMEMVSTGEAHISFSVPDTAVAKISPDLAVTVRAAVYPGRDFESRVTFVAPLPHPATFTYRVEARVVLSDEDVETRLLPGMAVQVRFSEAPSRTFIRIPPAWILRDDDGQPYVLVVDENNVVKQQTVRLGEPLDKGIHVTEGLNELDRIIAAGQRVVRPGERVEVLE